MSDARALQPLPLFEGCTPRELRRLAGLLTEVQVRPDRILMVEGAPAQQFAVITDGDVRVTSHIGGSEQELATISAPAFVGEMGLLDGGRCSATVRSIGPLTAHVSSPAEFSGIVAIPTVARNLAQAAERRTRANRAAQVPPIEITSRDGERFALRPTRFDDHDIAGVALNGLSSETMHQRFFSVRRFNDSAMRRAVDIDYTTQFSWLVVALETEGLPIVGEVRYCRLPEEPTTAEMAIVLADGYQSKGLGSVLLDAIDIAAEASDVESLVAEVLADNVRMIGLLRKIGAESLPSDDGTIARFGWKPAAAGSSIDWVTGEAVQSVATLIQSGAPAAR